MKFTEKQKDTILHSLTSHTHLLDLRIKRAKDEGDPFMVKAYSLELEKALTALATWEHELCSSS